MVGFRGLRRQLLVLGSTLLLVALAIPAPVALADDDEDFARAVEKVAKQLKLGVQPMVWTDGTSSFVDAATGQTLAGPPQADATHLAYAVVELKKPTIKAAEKLVRAKGNQPIIGNQAGLKPGQRALVLMASMDKPLGSGLPGGMQGLLSFSGPEGVPLYINGGLDPRAGSDWLVTFGQWPGQDQLLTATTPLQGIGVADDPAWNSADALGFGYRDGNRIVLVYPLPPGATLFGLQMQTVSEGHTLADVLSTPRGGDRFPLLEGVPPTDFCFSGTAYPVPDTSGVTTHYQVDFSFSSDPPLGPEALTGLELVDLATGATVDGSVQTFDEIGALRFNGGVPPGDYGFRLAGPGGPAEQAPFAAAFWDGTRMNLGGDLAGQLVGVAPCDLLPRPESGISDAAVAGVASALGIDTSGLIQMPVTTPDGTDVLVLSHDEASPPLLALVVDNRSSTALDFARRVGASNCELVGGAVSSGTIVERCPDGVERVFFLRLQETPDGSLDFGRAGSVDLYPQGFPNGVLPAGLDLTAAMSDGLGDAVDAALQPYQEAFLDVIVPPAS